MNSAILLLVLVAVAYVSIAALRRPGYALALIWAMHGTEQYLQSQLALFVVHQVLANVVPIAVATIAILMETSRRRTRIRFVTNHQLVILLILWAAGTSVWSIAPKDTIQHLEKAVPYFLGYCIVGPLCITKAEDVYDALRGFCIVGTPVGAGLFMAPMTGQHIVLKFGLLGNQLAVGTFGAYLAIASFALLLIEPHVRGRSIILLADTILGIAVCLRSGSRGQLIATVACLIICTYLIQKTVKSTDLSGIVVLSALLLLGSAYAIQEYAVKLIGYDYRWSSDSIREAIIEGRLAAAWKLWTYYARSSAFHWIVGLGSSASYAIIGIYCHIVPVEALCELGVVGLVLLVAIQYRAMSASWELVRTNSIGVTSRTAVAAMLSIFLCEFALQFKQGSLLGSFSLLAMAIVLGRLRVSETLERPAVQTNAASPDLLFFR